MRTLLVVDNPDSWPLRIEGAELVPAKRYLSDPEYSTLRGAVVFNLCRSYAYQRTGYYVSLLAEARGHRPQPSVATLQDLRHPGVTRVVSSELARMIQRHLGRLKSSEFVLSIYFGQPLARSHLPLARALFGQYPAPRSCARVQARQGRDLGAAAASDPSPARTCRPTHLEFVTSRGVGVLRGPSAAPQPEAASPLPPRRPRGSGRGRAAVRPGRPGSLRPGRPRRWRRHGAHHAQRPGSPSRSSTASSSEPRPR